MELGIAWDFRNAPVSKRYVKDTNNMHHPQLLFVLRIMENIPRDAIILEIGICDDDRVRLLKQYFPNVKGIDKRNCHEQDIQTDATILPEFEDNSIDLIVCTGVIAHVFLAKYPETYRHPPSNEDYPAKLLKTFRRVLKPEGKLEVQLYFNRSNCEFFKKEDLHRFEAGWNILEKEIWQMRMISFDPNVQEWIKKIDYIPEDDGHTVIDILLLLEKPKEKIAHET